MRGMQFRRDRGNLYAVDDRYGLVNPMWRNYPAWMIEQDPRIAHVYFEDFHTLALGDFTVTTVETSAGSATEALADAAGGMLLVTTDDQDNEETEFQVGEGAAGSHVGESFKLATGKPLWFEMRLAVGDATECDYLCGLCDTDGTLITAASSGVFFQKDDGDRNIDYHCELVTVDTTDDTGVDVVAATYNRYGIFYDGAGEVGYWIDGVEVGTSTTNIPTTELSVSFAIMAGAAAAKTMTIDYIKCAQIR